MWKLTTLPLENFQNERYQHYIDYISCNSNVGVNFVINLAYIVNITHFTGLFKNKLFIGNYLH